MTSQFPTSNIKKEESSIGSPCMHDFPGYDGYTAADLNNCSLNFEQTS